MGDISQSRYSIVSDLTKSKLQIMDEKQRIEGDIESKKAQILQYRQDILQAEKDSKEELKNSIESFKFAINKLEREIASNEKGKNTKGKLCEDKIKEIDKALEQLQEISKSAIEEAKL